MRTEILQLISSINPYDKLEEEHITNTIKWINSGEEIFRTQKPATPQKHLVSYFVLIDKVKKKILLMDHINAGLWLPSGGHVEPNEHPKATNGRSKVTNGHSKSLFGCLVILFHFIFKNKENYYLYINK